jgi:uncharacterized protein (DUF2384 family)
VAISFVFELLGPDGRLASEKTFTRGEVIIAAAPHLHGLPVSVLDQVVETVLANDDAVALPAVTGSRSGRRAVSSPTRSASQLWPSH